MLSFFKQVYKCLIKKENYFAGESLRGEFDSNRLEIYLKHDPSGTSFQNLNHWEQMKSINLTCLLKQIYKILKNLIYFVS